jgi:hypothetical protein
MKRAMSAPQIPSSGTQKNAEIRRIRFTAEALGGAKPIRSFTQPRRCTALEEVVDFVTLLPPAEWPEPTDHLDVALVSPGSPEPGPAWMTPPIQSDAPPAVTVAHAGVTIEWRPGRALVRAPAERFDELMAALADFAFYESELRTLERAVESCEADAAADTVRAYRIQHRDRQHWPRFAALIENFARLRLTFARLEPRLEKGSRTLPPAARRIMSRLIAKAEVHERLQALTDRLEACEDLYEGATDRIADYRGWRTGHLLEWGIIFLLAIEVAVMSADLYIRYLDYTDPTPAETSPPEPPHSKKN